MNLKKILIAILEWIFYSKCEVCKKRVPADEINHWAMYQHNGKTVEDICNSCVDTIIK